MKCIIKRLALLSATLMVLAVPVLAEQGTMKGMYGEEPQQGRKDECLLVAKNCANDVDTIQQRIDRIKGEIKKGTDVYTNDELKTLDRELENEILNLNTLTSGA